MFYLVMVVLLLGFWVGMVWVFFSRERWCKNGSIREGSETKL